METRNDGNTDGTSDIGYYVNSILDDVDYNFKDSKVKADGTCESKTRISPKAKEYRAYFDIICPRRSYKS